MKSAAVQAGAPAANLGAVQQSFEHAVEVVVAFGQLLASDGARDGVTEQEQAQFHVLAFGQGVGEPQRVVWTLAAVGLIVDDGEDVHRGILARAGGAGIGTDCGSPIGGCRSSRARAAGMSMRTQSPEAVVRAATIAIAPP